jgi:penicillin amidase
MLENDDVDLYVERFDPDNPRRVMYKGEWTDALVEEATIKVRFGRDEHWQVRVTQHGPVVTDLMRFALGYEGPDIALSWVWQHLEYTDLLAFYEMSRAKSLAAFEEAVSKITSPGLNISYVDADNNFAWWAAGRLEIRPPGTHPKRLLDGASGKHEIVGYVDFKDNPRLINPPSGYIVTANNLSTVKPVGPLPAMEGYWQPSERAERIEEVLETRSDWDIPSTQALQFDDEALAARRILPVWLELLDTAGLQGDEAQALQRLKAWDRKQGVDSVGAAIYQTMCMVLFEKTLGDEFTPLWLDAYSSVKDSWNAFKYWVGDADFPWWDDINTPEKETRADITRAAWRDAIAHLRTTLGGNLDDWHWGRLHTMTFIHPFGFIPGLGGIFNIGPFPASGADHAVNNMMWPGGLNFSVIAGPSTRRVIDYARPDEACAILPTGNSGHFRSPNYDDQAPMFMAGQYRRLNTTPAQVAADRRHELRLLPAR